MRHHLRLTVLVLGFMMLFPWAAQGGASRPGYFVRNPFDFSAAVIVTAHEPGAGEQKAVQVLQEEIEKRSGIKLDVVNQWPKTKQAVIAVGLQSAAGKFAGPFAAQLKGAQIPTAEGFALSVENEPRTAVIIGGQDTRGLLYGIGCLLRKMEMAPQKVGVPVGLHVTSAPKYPLRGHQLGYRPKVNAYDAWTEAQFDQYIRELALFGANSIEIVPPRTDDHKTSPQMKVSPIEMMERLSKIIDSYGLDVWVWYPNMGKNYTDAEAIKAELAERDEVFRRLKRVDHILVPGGDPGDLHPDVFFPWMDQVAVVMQRYHPQAKIWVSPQAFEPTKEWLESFYRHVNTKPAWLGGVAFAPWIATPLPEMRKIVDPSIKIRNYPDITHNVECQYPVRNWDLAFALTLHRECYNPRPLAMKVIHNVFADQTCGSLCYSEGINDDVNKFLWSGQDWDPTTPVADTLRDYCRLFISAELSEPLAESFLALEKNWEGPLATSQQVDATLVLWQHLEQRATPSVRQNYRFQMGLLRAHYDACIKARLIYETDLEAQALKVLENAAASSFAALSKAEAILRLAITEPRGVEHKARCVQLADALFASIGSQTSVARHAAQNRTRGAFLDGIDEPLNNAAWLRVEFRRARDLPGEADRLAAIAKILHRTDPGPGGIYDNLGAPGGSSRIINTVPWNEDPGTLKSPRITFYYEIDKAEDHDIPLAWKKQAHTLYGTPLRLAYDHLDPQATYSVRATYSGRTSRRISLKANDRLLISDNIQSRKPTTQEFTIPHQATATGHLELEWSSGEGERSCEVAEVWLIKHPAQGK